jgi:hypothetical protein
MSLESQLDVKGKLDKLQMFSSRQGNKLAQRTVVCLEALTMLSKLVHLLIAGKFDQGPEYTLLVAGNSFVRFFEGAKLVPSAWGIARGAARATRGL